MQQASSHLDAGTDSASKATSCSCLQACRDASWLGQSNTPAMMCAHCHAASSSGNSVMYRKHLLPCLNPLVIQLRIGGVRPALLDEALLDLHM